LSASVFCPMSMRARANCQLGSYRYRRVASKSANKAYCLLAFSVTSRYANKAYCLLVISVASRSANKAYCLLAFSVASRSANKTYRQANQCCRSGSGDFYPEDQRTGIDFPGSIPCLKLLFKFIKSIYLKFFPVKNSKKYEKFNFVRKMN
jgi:hypothetical protein